MSKVKTAIVHYWLKGIRGGEKVLQSLVRIFPDAELFTLFKSKDLEKIFNMTINSSILDNFIFIDKIYTLLLPIFPKFIEQFNLNEYDLVISSESGPAKGVITNPETCHICYCHSPMRYIWNMYHLYYNQSNIIKKLFMFYFIPKIRQWDVLTSFRVDYFIANSENVKNRIKKYYRRDSVVIHPPVKANKFHICKESKIDDYYFILSEFVPYKSIDLAISAFNENGKRLIIAGDGPNKKKLKKIARSRNIEFIGRVTDDELVDLYSKAKAFIFPGEEDFGITPLESMASGRPVIAYAKGGALETVIENVTGIFFKEQTIESLNKAIYEFEKKVDFFNPETIRNHALKFDVKIFETKLKSTIDKMYYAYQNRIPTIDWIK